MIAHESSVHMFVIRYDRNGVMVEAICRGETPEAASMRYLSQLQYYGVDVSMYSFVSSRQLKSLRKTQ